MIITFQKLLDPELLRTAWSRVRSNAGAPGVDKVSVQDFEDNLEDHLALLRNELLTSTYQPLALKTFTLRKDDGRQRILHIPAVRDRIVAQALVQTLQPVYESLFHNCSYAYRPGLSSQKALDRVERNLQRGRTWALYLDIENFFDSVDRDLLLEILGKTINDKRILRLIRLLLDSFDSEDKRGIAQGLPISPLLSNVYLHQLDDRLIRARWNYVRYSDNIIVLDREESAVQTAFEWIKEELATLKLNFNPDKTRIVHLSTGFSFLGFHFDDKGKKPDEPAFQRINKRVGGLLSKAFEYNDDQIRRKLENILRGWLNYFHLEGKDKKHLFDQLDQAIPDSGNAVPKLVLKAVLAFQLGDAENARTIIRTATVYPDEADLCFQWGVICDVLGLQKEAVDCFLTTFRLSPNHPDAAFHLGLYYLRRHQNDQAIRYLQKAVQENPESALYQFTLGTALQNISLNGAADKALRKAYQMDPSLAKRKSPVTDSSPIQIPSAEQQHLFLKLFQGREGVFARQWLHEDGKSGYATQRRPMTVKDVLEHVKGKQTLGYYIMRSDNTVKQLVFDIDITKQVRLDILAAPEELEDWRAFAWNDAQLLLKELAAHNMSGVAEDSGYKGMHVWVFFAEPQPAGRVILFARKLLAAVGPAPPGLHREVFPKQTSIAPNALGAMVKLPLGIHKAGNRRCHFVDAKGEPVQAPFDLLAQIHKVSTKDFMNAIESFKASSRLDPDAVDEEDQKKIDLIFLKCNVLRYLAQKAEKEKRLSHTDRLTLLGVLGHIGEAGRFNLHKIIGNTLNYDFRITDKWFQRRRGYPVSCPKIRVWQKDITPAVGCYCEFPDKPGNYPSPLLHADPDWVSKLKKKEEKMQKSAASESAPEEKKSAKAEKGELPAHEPRPPQPADNQKNETKPDSRKKTIPPQPSGSRNNELESLVADYLEALQEKRDLGNRIRRLETGLHKSADRIKSDCIETKMGTLRRLRVNDHFKWLLEL